MKALTFAGVETIEHGEAPDPKILDATDVIVKVERTAICGSDLHVYFGRETGIDDGTVMGHEFLGEIVEVGGAVDGLCKGQRVVSPFTTSCGECFYCTRGLTSRCESGELFGWVEKGRGLHGAQAEFVRVPMATTTLMEVPEGVSEDAALFCGDVLSTGFFCAESASVGPGSVTVVLGCGPVGLMAVLACGKLGAERVFAVDGVTERLKLARFFGAEPLSLNADPAAAIAEATQGRGADAVLEAVGSPGATRLAVDLVRPGGTIAAAGVHTEAAFAFPPGEAYDKNLTYRAGRCSARKGMERLLPRLSQGEWPVDRIVTHRASLAAGAELYRTFAEHREGCVKVILTP